MNAAMSRLLLIVLLVSVLLGSCGIPPVTSGTVYAAFQDDAGNQITLYQKPERVAVLFSSYAEIWELAGGSVSITVGESIERGFAGENALLVDKGAGKTIHTEELIAAEPDFVIGSTDLAEQVEVCSLLCSLGIPSAVFRVETFQDYANMMSICCSITGCTDNFRHYVSDVEQEIHDVLASIPESDQPKRILFIRCGSSASSTKAKTAQNHFVCDMLEELGTYNIAENAPVLLDGLSMEEILMENPEYIFFSTMGNEDAARAYMEQLLQTEPWQALDAVKNDHYVYLPKNLFQFKPNHRWGEAYHYLSEILYHAES